MELPTGLADAASGLGIEMSGTHDDTRMPLWSLDLSSRKQHTRAGGINGSERRVARRALSACRLFLFGWLWEYKLNYIDHNHNYPTSASASRIETSGTAI